jgi:hypothetical protein
VVVGWVLGMAPVLPGCQLNQPLGQAKLSSVSGDLDSLGLVYDPAKNDFVPQKVRLRDLRNFEELSGTGIQLNVGPVFSGLNALSASEFSLNIQAGSAVKINVFKQNNLFLPMDYQSFRFIATYHNFVNARSFYANLLSTLGIGCSNCFVQRTAYLDFVDETGSLGGTDNAAFIQGIDSFLVFKQSKYDFVNMGMNPTIIAHEVFHAMFDHLVAQAYVSKAYLESDDDEELEKALWAGLFQHGGALLSPSFRNDQVNSGTITFTFSIAGYTAESYTVLNAINEGLADYYAFVITNNPNILFLSLPIATLAESRRLDLDHRFEADTAKAIANGRTVTCNTSSGVNTCNSLRSIYQYVVGIVFARTLYEIGVQRGDHATVAQIVMRFLAAFNTTFTTAPTIQLVPLIAAIINQGTSAGLHTVFCSAFTKNFSAISAEINAAAGCP